MERDLTRDKTYVNDCQLEIDTLVKKSRFIERPMQIDRMLGGLRDRGTARSRKQPAREKIIIFVKFYVVLTLALWLSVFVSVSRSTIRSPDVATVEKSVKLCHFLFREWKRTRQLTVWKRKQTKAKSFNFIFRQILVSGRNLTCKIGCLFIYCVFVHACIIATLLVRGGIESNPGPAPAVTTSFRIISQNCRGLTDKHKLMKVLKKLYPVKSSSACSDPIVACLQETHCLDKYVINYQYRGKAVIDDGERNRKGSCILVPESFDLCGSRVSGSGRWSIAVVRPVQELHKYIIANIYAPNCHREALGCYQDFLSAIDELCEELTVEGSNYEILVAGDFNAVLDQNEGSSNRMQSTAEKDLVHYIKGEFSQRDLEEPSGFKGHTWRRGTCTSKLDYIFVSRSLLYKVATTATQWYLFGSNFDHAAISAQFMASPNTTTGRGFPKIFKSDIANEVDQQWLREQLLQCENQFLPHWTPHMKLDFIKTMLRSKALELRAMRRANDEKANIKEAIDNLALLVPLSIESSAKIDSLKLRLHELEEREAEILRIKAGIKWREEGEKSTSYFLARFKARSAGAILHSIQLGTRVVTGSMGILSVVQQFYKHLYNKPVPANLGDEQFCNDFFANCPTLDRAQRDLMAGPLTIEELKLSLDSCTDSAPGLDGIPYSFYSTYADILLKYILESWQYAVVNGELAESHKRSCISLLPKKGKDLSLIGNWRPISLSSCDLKIITKAYANRLKNILPSLLCEAQAAYTPGRDINFNNRLMKFAKMYATKSLEDFCIVSLDAQKAFDSVDHRYLVRVLEAYDFPQEFIGVFKTLYSNLLSVVQVNGYLSTEFEVKNGVKQGDALSCGLFVLAIDPLIRNIVNNVHIEGLLVPLGGNNLAEIKALAYADDVTIICRNASLQPIFDEYERLSKISGLVLNADKTEVFNLIDSPYSRSRVAYLGKESILQRVEKIKICGVWLSRSQEDEYRLNVEEKVGAMENIVTGWGRRNLTINGRMILAKTFLLSLIVFPAQVFRIKKKEIKKIEKLIYAFVNGAKNLYGPERIARANLKASKEKGGINGVDVESFVQALAVKQFSKASQNHPVLRDLQLSSTDELSLLARQIFRQNYKRFSIEHAMPDLSELEHISGIPVQLLVAPLTKASKFAAQLSIASLWDLQQIYIRGYHDRTKVLAILRAIPVELSNLVRAGSMLDFPLRIVWFNTGIIQSTEKIASKTVRVQLLLEKYPNMSVQIEKIYKRADWPPPGIDYQSWFKQVWLIKNPSLRAIRLKVFYKDIFSNERRFRFNMSDSPLCGKCGQIETVDHQLFVCDNAQRMWALYQRLTGDNIGSLFDVVACSSLPENELIKTILLKALIQIDRSANIGESEIIAQCIYYLGIESKVKGKSSKRFSEMCEKVKAQANVANGR